MDSPTDLLHHHKKAFHGKRSSGKHPQIDSPTSEEDNDPLTDDAASAMSVPAPSTQKAPRAANHSSHPAKPSRVRHQLASSSLLSDDGNDSQTYDGDVESIRTMAPSGQNTSKNFLYTNPQLSSSASTLTSQPEEAPTSSPETTAPIPLVAPNITISASAPVPSEPKPSEDAEKAFNPASLTPEDIQSFVQRAIKGEATRKYHINKPPADRPVRIYADGVYDLFHFGHALQLRQAKLSFPNVYLLVGVNTDEDVHSNKARCVMDHAERCEAVRHCRWVDEVIPDCPWVLDAAFLDKWQIDYVAHDEDPYVSPTHDDVYSFVKAQGRFIPTRRTPGVSTSDLLERIVSGYRRRDFDKKLEKMGHAELKAEGSDYEDKGMSSRSRSASPPQR
ncbi:hypothetical protein CONPUDRAFT_146522 [Coniophora puteana RWD-64-598 SS2]|uniref:choline-phosphate cytidylyltransferase n=1 Tax=Coniophora puteana (strain RWD-64-598) TaxID=741705 RepID=A0A5M3MBW3_CONPW|nr:uncharacterized protein CONPUDRAFT_146522 [Coniophora puteana RWD-64-598 SS2]EIW76729.1 hypothetical protein CONPUDRAFT_146522 [Coniophora puteana RWD-64-598 SS2]